MSSLDEGGIPLLFIQLNGGTEYNLSKMPDRNLAQLLEVVFEALKVHGMEMDGSGAWKWNNAGGDDLALLRLTGALLDGVGFTMDRVQKYEQDQIMQMQQKDEVQVVKETAPMNSSSMQKVEENEEDIRHRKRVERMTSQMLDRFDPRNSSSSASSLANELQGICGILDEGESVQLSGIENEKLRATLAQLFQLVGLELVEMDEDSEEEGEGLGNGNNGEKLMGYALPEKSGIRDTVTSNVNEVLRVCRFRSSGGSEDAPTSWATKATNDEIGQVEGESSDDDDGPAPLGTVAAAKASKRKRSLLNQSNKAVTGGIEEGGREEWMMVPGEHDFLKGIQSGRGRTFKNEKNRGQSIAAPSTAGPVNPKLLEEVNAIQRAYEQSRGPSLIDAHRQKQQELKQQQQQGQKTEWQWSREKNLDDGRRVDKNALHQVLGGASTELKSKFQGGLGR